MAVVFKNNASTALNGAIDGSQTSITVTSGAVFPQVVVRGNITAPSGGGNPTPDPTQYSSTNTADAGDYFYATITDGTNREVVKVVNVSSNTLTVVRAQEGTSGTVFGSGATIELRPTNQGLIDLKNDNFYRELARERVKYNGI